MRKRFEGSAGEVRRFWLDSTILAENPLGDPTARAIDVHVPHDFDESGRTRYPVLYALSGFTGSSIMMSNWKAFSENLPERLDRLREEGQIGPVLVVMADAFTAFGGNQYIDSSAIGNYASWFTREVVTFVDEVLPTLPAREHRALFGKSSGGYGAMIHGMLHPETWGALACHSGDLYFEYGYRPHFAETLEVLIQYPEANSRRADPERFIEALAADPNPKGSHIHALMTLAMAATYDPDPSLPRGYGIPFDLETGEIDEDRWRRWKRWDPVAIVDEHADALRGSALVFFDCGTRDQYGLLYGARMLARRLEALGVEHEYEEFDGTHSGIDHRMDVSLPKLYEAIRPR